MMAVCAFCQQEMTDRLGCTGMLTEIIGEAARPRIPHRDLAPWIPAPAFCRDCEVPVGSLHHPGCSCETCPFCGCQAITCGCF